ncbi:MAG: response regulator transcription factor [Anaeromyxobacteraceae bacterium]
MSEKISVLLVEDDEPLRESLASYLRLRDFEVIAVGDGLSFYRKLAGARFAVLVVDLGLPDQAGEVLVDYARRNTDSAIVVVTARDTIETRVGTYKSGADLFLAKPVDGRELAAALASLGSRRPPAGSAPPRAPWRLVTRERMLLGPGGERVPLTPKEHRFLQHLAAGAGRTVRREDLLGALYGRTDESAGRALETLVRRTRQTIAEKAGGIAPILTEHGVGYAFTESVAVD